MEHSKEPYDTTTEPQSPPPVYETPSSWDRFQDFMNTFWVYEILASIISLAMLATIYGILKLYNSTGVDFSWSLNSLIGLVATICQVALAIPLASGISQLKWLWYKENQKLTDLDKFDQSSRGPMGSLGLLFSRPFKFLGAFGATITIFTLAFHTLIQNAISTKSGLFEIPTFYDTDLGASYPQGNNYSSALDYSTGDTLGDQGPVLDMVADINYGMFYTEMDRDTQYQLSIASCYYGNCSWDHIQTLGVCSQCADVTSYIEETQNYYTLYDMSMSQDVGLISSEGNTLYPDSRVLQNIGPLIVHFAAMARGTINDQPVGVDCALYWCVLDQSNVNMTNFNVTNSTNTYWTDLSTSAQTVYKQTVDITLTPPTCYNEFAEEVSDTTLCTKTISARAQLALQNFFISTVVGFTGTANRNLTTDGWDISSEFVQLLFSTFSETTDILGRYNLIMSNIGVMMTSNIRQSAFQVGYSLSLGETWVWTTLYHIRWGYLALPTLLVVSSILFLIATIFKSWGQEKWKSSLLPLLFHPLGERPSVAPYRMSELKVAAKAKEVRLERGQTGSQFV